jgi:hypothetical protein
MRVRRQPRFEGWRYTGASNKSAAAVGKARAPRSLGRSRHARAAVESLPVGVELNTLVSS